MFDAASLQSAFGTLVNNTIPSSRRVDCPYTNTMIFINKIWNSSMETMGKPSIALKGGVGLGYAARLIVHMGGIIRAGVKRVTAMAKGRTYSFGISTAIKVTKNQFSDLTYDGTILCLHNGIYKESDLASYKKKYAPFFLKKMKETFGDDFKATEDDIEIKEEDEETDE